MSYLAFRRSLTTSLPHSRYLSYDLLKRSDRIVGKFWENFEKILKFFDENSMEKWNFMIFGKFVSKIRAIGNKIIFLQQFLVYWHKKIGRALLPYKIPIGIVWNSPRTRCHSYRPQYLKDNLSKFQWNIWNFKVKKREIRLCISLKYCWYFRIRFWELLIRFCELRLIVKKLLELQFWYKAVFPFIFTMSG